MNISNIRHRRHKKKNNKTIQQQQIQTKLTTKLERNIIRHMPNNKHNTLQQPFDHKTVNTLRRRDTRINPIWRQNTNPTMEEKKKIQQK